MEEQQQGKLMEILNTTFQAISGVINSAVKVAHAPEYTDSTATVEFNVHRTMDSETGNVRLDIKQEVKLFLDGNLVTPEELQEIFDTNETIQSLEAQVREAERRMVEERAAKQNTPQDQKGKIITLDSARAISHP